MVPGPGLEPGQDCSHKILSLARLPTSATPAHYSAGAAPSSRGGRKRLIVAWDGEFKRNVTRSNRDLEPRASPASRGARPRLLAGTIACIILLTTYRVSDTVRVKML